MTTARPCAATTKAGKPCSAPAVTGSLYCFTHSPERARERAEARRRGGENRRRPRVATQQVEAVDIRSIAGVQDLLEAVVVDVLALENGTQRARVIAQLVGQALKAIEVGEIAQRVEALEVRLAAAGAG